MTNSLPDPSSGRASRAISRRTLLRGTTLTTGLVLTGLRSTTLHAGDASHHDGTRDSSPREFILTAEEIDQEIMPGMTIRAWGYNGQTPGPEIRVREGDPVRIVLRNNLPVPTTIHWHGVHLPPEMDGPAGLNQAPVMPGEEFVYEFTATPAGTRWYHSHADPALQVPMGLYGPLIIEPANQGEAPPYDREYTMILGEWDSELTPEVAAGASERGPKDKLLRGGELGSDMFLINGLAHGGIPPIVVTEGDRVLLRMINAGHIPHPVHIHGHSFRIVATDGNPVPPAAQWLKDTVLIGPAERYDLAFDAVHPGVWMFHCHIEHHMANGMMTVIQYEGHQPTGPAAEALEGPQPGAHVHGTSQSETTPPNPAPADTASSDGDGAQVTLVDDRFDPVELTVVQGTTVTWTNKGANFHSLKAYDGSFDSGKLAPGESYSYTFDQPGLFPYICSHHGLQGMIGQVVVNE
ncbi:MAG TPA: multicopper oxidase domain-containing protein [Thermomicrobiales bacterium]|nr:multicopper oxidase domain-containing protein [Thermomicrobiales bacterium]